MPPPPRQLGSIHSCAPPSVSCNSSCNTSKLARQVLECFTRDANSWRSGGLRPRTRGHLEEQALAGEGQGQPGKGARRVVAGCRCAKSDGPPEMAMSSRQSGGEGFGSRSGPLCSAPPLGGCRTVACPTRHSPVCQLRWLAHISRGRNCADDASPRLSPRTATLHPQRRAQRRAQLARPPAFSPQRRGHP